MVMQQYVLLSLDYLDSLVLLLVVVVQQVVVLICYHHHHHHHHLFQHLNLVEIQPFVVDVL